jgi:hypothetical protein
MDERLRFVARLFEGEKIAVVCREFGISCNTRFFGSISRRRCTVTWSVGFMLDTRLRRVKLRSFQCRGSGQGRR